MHRRKSRDGRDDVTRWRTGFAIIVMRDFAAQPGAALFMVLQLGFTLPVLPALSRHDRHDYVGIARMRWNCSSGITLAMQT